MSCLTWVLGTELTPLRAWRVLLAAEASLQLHTVFSCPQLRRVFITVTNAYERDVGKIDLGSRFQSFGVVLGLIFKYELQ